MRAAVDGVMLLAKLKTDSEVAVVVLECDVDVRRRLAALP